MIQGAAGGVGAESAWPPVSPPAAMTGKESTARPEAKPLPGFAKGENPATA